MYKLCEIAYNLCSETNKKSKKRASKPPTSEQNSSQNPPRPPPKAQNVSVEIPKSQKVPPPNPMNLSPDTSYSERIQKKLRSLSDDIPLDNVSTPPENAASPKAIYAKNYQKRDLNDEQLGLSNTSNIMASTPKQVDPIPPNVPSVPKLGFLGDIAAFKDKGNKLKPVDVKRSDRPKDNRTNILDQIRGNKVKLKSKDDRKIMPKKEEKKNLIFEAMKHRRDFVGDSSSEEDDSWGSDSD